MSISTSIFFSNAVGRDTSVGSENYTFLLYTPRKNPNIGRSFPISKCIFISEIKPRLVLIPPKKKNSNEGYLTTSDKPVKPCGLYSTNELY
jgi:hypothetical protein